MNLFFAKNILNIYVFHKIILLTQKIARIYISLLRQ